jgi:hypothetical protein
LHPALKWLSRTTQTLKCQLKTRRPSQVAWR